MIPTRYAVGEYHRRFLVGGLRLRISSAVPPKDNADSALRIYRHLGPGSERSPRRRANGKGTEMSSVRLGLISAVATIALAAGCATGGRSGTLPTVTNPTEAANITLYRDGSWAGWFATMRVELDGQEIYRIGRNEAFSLTLDPGQYLLVYTLGFNECRRIIWADPRQNQRIRLSPTCT
jgi:hypothetical protein